MRTRKKIRMRTSIRYSYFIIACILLVVSSSCLSKIMLVKESIYNKKEI